ncbi:DUF2934 domain-containing protein [Sulfuricella sp. T08]|uniref:DUF2934 domain-containing protein n=1 Tax=Sulfuricella sp. T08 TaxID=1632857 RepID=UPI0011866EBD|nr:DUF2934 domain-containing protein [Sulfuricella sp. T08]
MPTVKSKSEGKKAPSPLVPKSAAAKKSQPGPSASEQKMPVTPEQRYQMITEAAYFHAEQRGFVGGDPVLDWLEAEAAIDCIIQQPGKEPQMSEKQAFQQKLEAQIKEWDAKLEELKSKAQDAKTEIRADYEKQLEILASKRDLARTKVLELRQRTEGAWDDLKGGTEKAWEEMRKALDHIASRFK